MIRFYIIGGQGKKGQYGTNHNILRDMRMSRVVQMSEFDIFTLF